MSGSKLKASQFGLRSLFGLTATVSVLIVFIQFTSVWFPQIFIVSIGISFVCAMFGLALVTFAGLIAFSIVGSKVNDENDSDNLCRCARLAATGLIAMLPLVFWFTIIPMIPKW